MSLKRLTKRVFNNSSTAVQCLSITQKKIVNILTVGIVGIVNYIKTRYLQ